MPIDLLDRPATIDDVLREVSRIKSIVTDAVDDGVKSAIKAIKNSRHAAEDVLDEAEHAIKKRPFEAIGVFFAAGRINHRSRRYTYCRARPGRSGSPRVKVTT